MNIDPQKQPIPLKIENTFYVEHLLERILVSVVSEKSTSVSLVNGSDRFEPYYVNKDRNFLLFSIPKPEPGKWSLEADNNDGIQYWIDRIHPEASIGQYVPKIVVYVKVDNEPKTHNDIEVSGIITDTNNIGFSLGAFNSVSGIKYEGLLPKNISPGKYVIDIRVKDRYSGVEMANVRDVFKIEPHDVIILQGQVDTTKATETISNGPQIINPPIYNPSSNGNNQMSIEVILIMMSVILIAIIIGFAFKSNKSTRIPSTKLVISEIKNELDRCGNKLSVSSLKKIFMIVEKQKPEYIDNIQNEMVKMIHNCVFDKEKGYAGMKSDMEVIYELYMTNSVGSHILRSNFVKMAFQGSIKFSRVDFLYDHKEVFLWIKDCKYEVDLIISAHKGEPIADLLSLYVGIVCDRIEKNDTALARMLFEIYEKLDKIKSNVVEDDAGWHSDMAIIYYSLYKGLRNRFTHVLEGDNMKKMRYFQDDIRGAIYNVMKSISDKQSDQVGYMLSDSHITIIEETIFSVIRSDR